MLEDFSHRPHLRRGTLAAPRGGNLINRGPQRRSLRIKTLENFSEVRVHASIVAQPTTENRQLTIRQQLRSAGSATPSATSGRGSRKRSRRRRESRRSPGVPPL